MADSIDVSFADEGPGDAGAPTRPEDIFAEMRDLLKDILAAIKEKFVQATTGAGEGGGLGLDLLGGFKGALSAAAKGLAIFGLAVEGVKTAFGLLRGALSMFADVNATIAIAFERLQLFLRGVLVVMAEALAPVLDELTIIFKELIAVLVTVFVEIFTLIRPALLQFLDAIKQLVQFLNRFFDIKPLDIEEQGLRRSATGVANVLGQFAATANNPQLAPAVNVNIMADDAGFVEGLLVEALGFGRIAVEDLIVTGGRPGSLFQRAVDRGAFEGITPRKNESFIGGIGDLLGF